MAGTTINTGGGGLVIGAGGIASGAGGDIVIDAPQRDVYLAEADLVAFVRSLAEVKAALIGAGVVGAAALAAQVSELERIVLDQGGAVDRASAARLFGKVRYAGRVAPAVTAAVSRACAPLRARPPAEVFISYKREERGRIQPMADALRALAVSVWYDRELEPGRSFTPAICEELDGCAVQIVCWSAPAMGSDWVRGEAEYGRSRGVLLPVLMAPCQIMPPFNMIHTEDLCDWFGEAAHEGWRKVVRTIAARLSRPGLEDLSLLIASHDPLGVQRWKQAYPDDPAARTLG